MIPKFFKNKVIDINNQTYYLDHFMEDLEPSPAFFILDISNNDVLE